MMELELSLLNHASNRIKKQNYLFNFRITLCLLFFSSAQSTRPGGYDVSEPSVLSSTSTSPVKPSTPLLIFLQTLQETAFTLTTSAKPNSDFDPKLYVDLPLKFNLSTTEKAFEDLPRSANGTVLSLKDFETFIHNYFEDAGADLELYQPPDFVPNPNGFLPTVKHPEVRAWALEVHSLWKNLSRRVSATVQNQPQWHTLLPLPNNVIVPGSRFREVYYWDSYWIIRGILASKMYDTAKAIVSNLVFLVQEYGFVLNGARAYYTNRSQPPLLSAMIYEIYIRTGDAKFVEKSLPALLNEYQFWSSGIHSVTVEDHEGSAHNLSRYYALWNKPRPESSTKDKELASKLTNESERQHFYREVASTAETGWDFSTRWMRNPPNIMTLATTSILPVDLNALILSMELNIAFFANITGDIETAERFSEYSEARVKAITRVFWNAEMGQWRDYWLADNLCSEPEVWRAQRQNQNLFASNFVPLWIKPFYSNNLIVEKALESLKLSGLICDAGVATSLTNSSQQWDYPNGWAPLQHMIIEGLSKSGLENARAMAEDIAVRWIKSNYVSFKKTGVMHEKYDVTRCGEYGGGGEYKPQTGFGWTNGVVLALLEEFGWPQDRNINC